MIEAEEYFKRNNGYVADDQRYKQFQVDAKDEEKWRQELIFRHLEEMYHEENTIWVHLTILVDLLNDSTEDKKMNLMRLLFELKKLRFMPVWNLLLILKPLVSGEHCLLDQLQNYESLKSELEDIIDRFIPYNMENEHENFQERYQHLLHDYNNIK